MEGFELKYDYEEALRRLGKTTADVDEVRSALELEGDVPKSVTDKQVSKIKLKIPRKILNLVKSFFYFLMLVEVLVKL